MYDIIIYVKGKSIETSFYYNESSGILCSNKTIPNLLIRIQRLYPILFNDIQRNSIQDIVRYFSQTKRLRCFSFSNT